MGAFLAPANGVPTWVGFAMLAYKILITCGLLIQANTVT